jgi:hypothetical protein
MERGRAKTKGGGKDQEQTMNEYSLYMYSNRKSPDWAWALGRGLGTRCASRRICAEGAPLVYGDRGSGDLWAVASADVRWWAWTNTYDLRTKGRSGVSTTEP